MLITFLLGVAAGWFAPAVEPRVADLLKGLVSSDVPISPVELRAYSLALCLTGAAILSMIIGNPHAFPLAIGAVLGVFGPRLRERYRGQRVPDYDS